MRSSDLISARQLRRCFSRHKGEERDAYFTFIMPRRPMTMKRAWAAHTPRVDYRLQRLPYIARRRGIHAMGLAATLRCSPCRRGPRRQAGRALHGADTEMTSIFDCMASIPIQIEGCRAISDFTAARWAHGHGKQRPPAFGACVVVCVWASGVPLKSDSRK